MLAALARFWQLGELPPGLYRDEAFNGLDALDVLDGQHALFFPANNGREPAYIYLTSLFVGLFGRTALAVRLGAAVVGTLTTVLVYKLAAVWYGRFPALFAAFTWAVTLWPVHLSRIGLRPILLAPFLAATFWLGTLAYRRQNRWLWLLAGLVYGAAYYTYLAVRFTPVLLLALAVFLIWRGRWPRLWPGVIWFGLGTAVALTPFAILVMQQPDILLGRTGQVSILNTAVNHGSFWSTLWQQIGQAVGMFFWRGDTILRHNPAGRAVFDWFMTLPFLIGLGWCVKNWRRPAAMALLLWTAVMLGPTILAADTPHFLRASGLLPGIIILPAIGLSQVWEWDRVAGWLRKTAVILLAAGSLTMTIRDYVNYGQSPDTGYLFEQAARTLAEKVNEDILGLNNFMDDRYWSGWPSVQFLVTNPNNQRFLPENGLPPLTRLSQLFVWPYANRDFISQALPPNALVWSETGPLSRGDLEPAPYPLYDRYLITSVPPELPLAANFDDLLTLHQAQASLLDPQTLQVDLIWSANNPPSQPLAVFIHVTSSEGNIAQNDAPPGSGNWPANWWRPGLFLHDRHTILLPGPFDPARHQILMGIYDTQTGLRLPILNTSNEIMGDHWELKIDD
jgi:4-amino-4-deoxy-L-arabinose transferase-like glycosyltransferase